MNTKPKTIDLGGIKYAMYSELGESHTFLERLADAGKIGKVNWNGNNYYEVEATKKVVNNMREIPQGYVRAVDHAILLGSDSAKASELCNQRNAPAKKVLVGNTRPVWFVDKTWLERQLGKSPRTAVTKKVTIAPVDIKESIEVIKTSGDKSVADQIEALQKTIEGLKTALQSISKGGGRSAPAIPKVTEETAVAEGYRWIQDLATELEVSHSTLLGWKSRGQVRAYKVQGRLFLNVEDTERMYLKLDENRAIIARKLGSSTNNNLRTNGVS